MKKRILVIGASGMAGHVISRYLSNNDNLEVIRLARDKQNSNVDIHADVTDFTFLESIIKELKLDYVINAIGILNKDAEDHPDKAILLNSYLPHFLAKVLDQVSARLIHISTDCVFSGEKGFYKENDDKDGYGFYAQSKAIGEVTYGNHLTIRTSIIGPEIKTKGIGLLHWTLNQKGKIKGYSSAYWGGVTTLELAKTIDTIINRNPINGLIHLTNNERISKYELLKLFNEVFALKLDIESDDIYKVDKSILNTNPKLNLHVPTYRQMIEDLREWVYCNKEVYQHYNLF